MVLPFLALYLTQEIGLSLTVAGQALGVYGLGHLAGAWLGGWLCDRLGAMRIQFYSLLLSGVGLLVLEHLRTLGPILVAIFFVATVAEALRPANSAALAILTPPRLRTRAVALNRLALNLGFAIGPAVGGWLATYDYAWIFRVDGWTCIAAALVLHALFRGRRIETEEGASTAAEGAELHPLRDAGFLGFLLLTSVASVCFFQVLSTYPIYLKGIYGLDEARFGLLMSLNAALILAFEMVLTHRTETRRPLAVAGVGIFFCCAGLAVLPLGNGFAFAAVAMAVFTVGEMLYVPAAGGWVANRAGALHRGKYMGLYTMGWSVGFIAGPATGTRLYEGAGPEVLWLGVGVLGVALWLGFEALDRRLRRLPTPAALCADATRCE